MDILEMLKSQASSLLDEDLEYYLTELHTGAYEEGYIRSCEKVIDEILSSRIQKVSSSSKGVNLSSILLNADFFRDGAKEEKELTPEKNFWKNLELNRKLRVNMDSFLDLVKGNPFLDERYIDLNFSKFKSDEISAFLETIPFSECFLEKYFSELDKSKVSRYQKFSEDFFMKHYKELKVTTVLTKGVNEWRKKEKRSSKLSVFLRLKGVKI